MKKFKLGFCPTRRDCFSKDEAQKFRRLIQQSVAKYDIDIIDLKGINAEELLCDRHDLEAAIDRFQSAKVDAMFFPHCNFGSEMLVSQVALAVGKPVLLWGPRDDAPDASGIRSRDSQCGLFATGKVLRRHNVSFTYLTNTPVDSLEFHEGFSKFQRVAQVVNAVKNLRILQIDTRPEPFASVICNENELLERFNVHVYPIAITELIAEMKHVMSENGAEYQAAVDKISLYDKRGNAKDIQKSSALKVAMKRFADFYGCSAIAIQCWSALQMDIGIMPCLSNALLTDEGIPVACETDLCGAVTAVMVKAAAGQDAVPFFADITVRHPQNDNAELLWHCGNFPPSLAKDAALMSVGGNPYMPDKNYGVVNWELKSGDITVARFDGDHGSYRLLIGEAKTTDGPKNLGSYVWLETDNWKKWEHRLAEGPYIHHVAGAYGHFGEILLEACRYLNGLIPDVVQPTEQQLVERWW